MPRTRVGRTIHRCTACGGSSPRWAGRCASCGEWNSLVEEVELGAEVSTALATDCAVPLAEVPVPGSIPRPTGLDELDRVLGGGLLAGSATLVGGEPGIGKSTLLLQALASCARRGARCLLASAEESKPQVRLRAERLGALEPGLWLVAETTMPGIVRAVDDVAPHVVVVDSIQAVHHPGLSSPPGSVTQVRACTEHLVRLAKERGPAVVLVGHVNKEGMLAGPRVLEHMVDTVLSFEGERHHALRLVRVVKHRFGSTGELGLFEMSHRGLLGLPDAAGLFLGDRHHGVAGSSVVPVMEGQRPLLVELQALVSPPSASVPRRSAQGLDGARLALALAVLERRAGLRLSGRDVFASAVGGVRVTEPGADLALALALASAHTGIGLPPELVACAEVGLCGELRQVSRTRPRLAEAARLGFRSAILPTSAPDPPPGLSVVRAATLAEAIERLGLARTSN